MAVVGAGPGGGRVRVGGGVDGLRRARLHAGAAARPRAGGVVVRCRVCRGDADDRPRGRPAAAPPTRAGAVVGTGPPAARGVVDAPPASSTASTAYGRRVDDIRRLAATRVTRSSRLSGADHGHRERDPTPAANRVVLVLIWGCEPW